MIALRTQGSSGWKRNTAPSIVKKKIYKIKNGYYLIFPSFVLEGDLWGQGETKGIRIIKNKIHLVFKINLHTSGKW
jgi:hypothetical protein